MAVPPSSASALNVFLSFRGTDTRYGSTRNLWKALHDREIRTFMDDDEFQKREKPFDYMRRRLRGSYGKAMAKPEERSNDNMGWLQKLKNVMYQVANLIGFLLQNGDGYEHEFDNQRNKPVADYLVGLESQMQNVTWLLNVGSRKEVHMVGIHGIGGIGKTTLALEVYNLIAHQFEGSCFLENVRENSEKHGLLYLQKILLFEIVGEKKIELTSVVQGISIIQQRLQRKKVLLILDDVDKWEQLQAIVGGLEWFGPGSRVIITTRDKHLLTRHGVESTYEVKELKEKDALELLRWKAFETEIFDQSYEDILKYAVTCASSLPLALEVIGSNLSKKSIEEMTSALDQYESISNEDIQTILKVSIDALEKEEKSVFLDIACCFKGHQLAMVEKALHAHYGDNKEDHIRALVEKSLIKISEFGNVTLHDLIEDIGKEIVKQESPDEPGKRSRLWFPDDIVQVLEKNTGTCKIEIIYLDSRIKVKWDGEAFKKMQNLRTLIIRRGHFSESPKHLPNSLRILEWWLYPSSGLPSNFCPNQLAICNLVSSDLTSFMWGDLSKKARKFENMRVLNLDYCKFLTSIPKVSSLPNLEEISFQYCENLITIDDSVGLLSKLKILSVKDCRKLVSFPPLKSTSLELLDLSYCNCLESFPTTCQSLGELKILNVRGCRKLKSIPSLNLASLEQLDLSYCNSVMSIPPMYWSLSKLKILSVRGHNNLWSISPLMLSSLEQLDLSYCVSLESFQLEDSLLDKLKILSAHHCQMLTSFSSLKMASLEQLDLSDCISLETFPPVNGLLDKLKILSVKGCNNLRSIPSLKLALLEQLDLSFCVHLECLPPMDELLDKLKILSVKGCSNLRSIPPLKLPSLEQLDLSSCDSLESFPEILAEMKNITQLHLDNTPIKEMPFSFQYLTRLQTLYLSECGIVQLPSGIVMMSKLTKLTIENGGWLFPKQEQGQEKVSPMQSSQVEFLRLRKCNLSYECLAIGLKWFVNVKELYLSGSKFTVLPKCIDKCHFLWKLVLDNCKELKEIKGIPPSLKTLCALNCKSLTSLCKSNLLNQKLHEAGNTWFRLPRAKIPKWFNHQCMQGLSISFWFRNKFPAIAFCVVSPLTWYYSQSPIRVIINGNKFFYRDGEKKYKRSEMYHLHIFHMQMEKFNDNLNNTILENKWNHAEVDLGFPFQKSGIHVLKQKSSMKDIRFTNPENDVNIED